MPAVLLQGTGCQLTSNHMNRELSVQILDTVEEHEQEKE
jgi:hypothetical protein